jgi:Amt family ammonium transporter
MTSAAKYLMICILAALAVQGHASVIVAGDDFKQFDIIPDFELLILGGVFVILLQAGFAVAEGGYEKSLKSFYGLCINYLAAILGTFFFGLVYSVSFDPQGAEHALKVLSNIHGWHWNVIFFYTLMATTITTIVGRIFPADYSVPAYAFISFLVAGVIFPFFSCWVWGSILYDSGWLKQLGFIDYAGSTVVHSSAAWVVLAGYLVLRSTSQIQMEKRDVIFDDYKILSFALAGFILWLAWSGLNIIYISDIPVSIVTIVLSAVAALIGSVVTVVVFSLFFNKKIAWEAMLKATLGALVAVTASCGFVSISTAAVIGGGAGLITLYSPNLLKKWLDSKHIREVIAVHGLCGIWGTLAVSLSGQVLGNMTHSVGLKTQLTGILVCFIWSFGTAFVAFWSMKMLGIKFRTSSVTDKV